MKAAVGSASMEEMTILVVDLDSEEADDAVPVAEVTVRPVLWDNLIEMETRRLE
jgi:hypothetical protein